MRRVRLSEILQKKREEIKKRKRELPEKELLKLLEKVPPPRGFLKAIQNEPFAVIAEIKRASPSEGKMRNGDVPSLAALFNRSRACCLSILTDVHFGGSLQDLKLSRGLTEKPLLRKDFILDPYQILEARVFGADAILLIASLLSEKELKAFYERAKELDLDVLIELHTKEEIPKIPAEAPLLGINNRDLHSEDYRTSLSVTEELFPLLPKGKTVIAESGIKTKEDVKRLKALGVSGILVGSSLMKAEDPVKKLEELIFKMV